MNTTASAVPQDLAACIGHMLAQRGLGWVRLHTLFVVRATGSMYAAAKALGLSGVSNVRRRLLTLEQSLGVTLVVSEKGGSRLSALAEELAKSLGPHFEPPVRKG